MNKHTKIFSKVATGFAGAAALAAGTEAYADVVSATPPANFVGVLSGTAHQAPWDVNSDGTPDFALFWSQATATGNWVSGIYGYGGVGVAAAVAYAGAYVTYVNRLAVGSMVGPASNFAQDPGYVAAFASRFSGTFYGQFSPPNTRGFIGFEFTAVDGLHYGYLELMTSQFVNAGNPGGQTFFRASYETTPNTAITVVPEPGSLASLAFGAAMLGGLALKRRKSAAKV